MNEKVAELPATQSSGQVSAFLKDYRRFPTVQYLREAARRRGPRFAYEVGDGGAGADVGIQRNWNALDAVEIVPRYGVSATLPATEVELFGQRWAAPIGIAPMGSPGIVWPGADKALAAAAQKLRVPYGLSTVAGLTIEEAGRIAPDSFWFQIYRFAQNEHAMGIDLIKRADAAGAKVLVLTLDTPIRTTRTREVLAGIASPFRFTPKMIWEAIQCPEYCTSFLSNGIPRFANFGKYAPPGIDINGMVTFMQGQMRGAFTWDDVKRYRDHWKKPLAVKGIMHPEDAEKAIALGAEAVWVSNHGGRQIEALPATIDVLPSIASAVGGRAKVLFDSGVRSGGDVVRAMALGADFVFAGKGFLWGLGAMGAAGPEHTVNLYIDEIKAALGQIGAKTFAEARAANIRHPGAYK